MNDQMNKGFRSISITIFAAALLYKLLAIASSGMEGYTKTDLLLFLILTILITWMFLSNVFDAIDGVMGFIRQHIVKKPHWTGRPTVEE
jgi:hypothetical protein